MGEIESCTSRMLALRVMSMRASVESVFTVPVMTRAEGGDAHPPHGDSHVSVWALKKSDVFSFAVRLSG